MKTSPRVRATLVALFAAPAALAQHADLEEIVVTANPLRVGATDLAQAAIVLAGDDLSRQVGSSLGETLAAQPGVTASFFGPRASRPIIRGLSGERVLMLQNGVGALDVSNLSPDHSVGIEEILAAQVEVLKGPSTLLYGSGAVGGVVNVVDGRIPAAGEPGWSAAGEVRAGTVDDERSAAARVDGRTGPVGLHAQGYYREADDYDIPGYAWSRAAREEAVAAGDEPDLTRGTVENSDSETEGGALGASWIGDGVLVGLSWGRHETNYGLPGPAEHAEDGEAEPAAPEAIRIDQQQDRYDLRAEWTDLGRAIDGVLLQAAYNQYEHVELEGTEVGTRFVQDALDARLHLDHVALAGWEGTVGLQYTHDDLDAVGAEAYIPPSTTTSQSLFVVERRRIGSVNLDLGGRVERQDVDTTADRRAYGATALTLAAGALWSLGGELTGAVQLTRSERHPQAAELYAEGAHLAVRRYEIGDDRLGKETATTLDVGLRGEGDLHWHVSLYYSDFSDYIYGEASGDEVDGLPVYRYVQDDATFRGLEAELEFPLYERGDRAVHARIGGDVVRGRLTDGGDLPLIPPLRLLAALEYDAGPLHAALDVQWFDDQDRTARGETPTEGGTLLGAEVSYRWARRDPGVLVFLRASNLLDEELRRHSSPLKDYVPLPGASVLLGVRVGF